MKSEVAQYRFGDAQPQYVIVEEILKELGTSVTDDERALAFTIVTVTEDFKKVGRHGSKRVNKQLRLTPDGHMMLRQISLEELADPERRRRFKDALQVAHRHANKRLRRHILARTAKRAH